MGFLWTGAVLWGLFLTLVTVAVPAGGGALAFFLVGWTPMGLLVWFVAHRAAKRDAAHQAMLVAAEVSPGAGFDHAESGTGLALNPQARTLTLLIGGQWKTYSYADVREWEAIKETPGVVVGGNLAAVGAEVAMRRQAAAHTGFFVTVRDVQHPKWRIAMKDTGVQARWMEIMRQEINER